MSKNNKNQMPLYQKNHMESWDVNPSSKKIICDLPRDLEAVPNSDPYKDHGKRSLFKDHDPYFNFRDLYWSLKQGSRRLMILILILIRITVILDPYKDHGAIHDPYKDHGNPWSLLRIKLGMSARLWSLFRSTQRN